MQNPYNILDGLGGRLQKGSMKRIAWVRNGSANLVFIEQALMSKYGIRVWGRDLSNDKVRSFLVPKGQALWAEYVMLRYGLELLTPTEDPNAAAKVAAKRDQVDGKMMKPWSEKGVKRGGFVSGVVETMTPIKFSLSPDRILGKREAKPKKKRGKR